MFSKLTGVVVDVALGPRGAVALVVRVAIERDAVARFAARVGNVQLANVEASRSLVAQNVLHFQRTRTVRVEDISGGGALGITD